MQILSRQETIDQSTRTLGRWRDIWIENAKENKKNYNKETVIDFSKRNENCIIFAFGPSFEKNLDQVINQELHHNNDIIAVDKAAGELLKKGVFPKTIVTADARLPINECIDFNVINPKLLKRITLFACVTSHPSWAQKWAEIGGEIKFYINKDGIRSHHIFREHFNYDTDLGQEEALLIPAGTNVANTAYILAAILYNYPKIFLCAFDYSFRFNENYYGTKDYEAVHRDIQIQKKHTESHMTTLGIDNDLLQTSLNMEFSCKWLLGFINGVAKSGVKTINLTGEGILMTPFQARIKEA